MLKVTTVHGKTYEGDYAALDPITRSLILKNTNGDSNSVVIINAAHIATVSNNNNSNSLNNLKPDTSRATISLQELEQHENQCAQQAQKSLTSLNLNVPGEIQILYDRISLLFPNCCWNNESIEILEEYSIAPPYNAVTVLPGKDGAGISRIRMILEGERRKLNLA